MCVALFGGMDRLEKHYLEEAARLGFDLRVFSKSETNFDKKIRNMDAIVIFTNKVSHNVKKSAVKMARAEDIPVFLHHSCGVCTLRECLGCIMTIINGKKGMKSLS